MALSFNTVQKAYVVLNNLKRDHLPELRIPSWPEDMAEWSNTKKEDPPVNVVFGWDKKSDEGWESLAFFIENPSQKLIDAFNQLNDIKSNSSICGPYRLNKRKWCFGWF